MAAQAAVLITIHPEAIRQVAVEALIMVISSVPEAAAVLVRRVHLAEVAAAVEILEQIQEPVQLLVVLH